MTVERLYDSVHARWRPEDVAAALVDVVAAAVSGSPFERRVRAVIGSYAAEATRWGGITSMAKDFERPVPAEVQLRTVSELADVAGVPTAPLPDPADAAAVRVWLTKTGSAIGWEPAPQAERRNAGVGRQARRLWRALDHASDKTDRLARMATLHRAATVGRSAFATLVSIDDFAADPVTAAYVAYNTARRNLRREFALSGKAGTTDAVLELLGEILASREETRWDVVAASRPSPSVLRRLDDTARGELLGAWSAEMRRAAAFLAELSAEHPGIEGRRTVRRGDNSTSWNLAARWYNTSRDNWMACLRASGVDSVLAELCPPKALRVMAADLYHWHSVSGEDAHSDSAVARSLPTPWAVLTAAARCGAADVRSACAAVSVDPAGWVGVRGPRDPEPAAPTPELVYGVSVADPLLAELLRAHKVWAGPSKVDADTIDPMICQIAAESRTEDFGR